jgi:hypothetical protein
MKKVFIFPLAAVLIFGLAAPSFADTIRLKDGTVIRGQIIGFKDQQFTVLIGTGERGRRSRTLLYIEDVESIEFDSAAGMNTAGADTSASTTPPARTSSNEPLRTPTDTTTNPPPTSSTRTQSATNASPNFFPVKVNVRADNTSNGWTNSGLVVRRGQRLRITASGRVSLGGGRFATPAGLPTVPDKDKLMRNEPTGALIAVIGDDNDDFIMIGRTREFVAQRDGVLFLGVNEGNLNDNSGAFEAVIEVEAVSSASR